MSQSLVNNYIHLIFSTKNLSNMILPEIEELHKYITGICGKLYFHIIQIGGTLDHIHILCELSKKIILIELLEEIRSSSSKWIKSKGIDFQKFYWQNGYGSFTVSPDLVQIVKKYIENQKNTIRKVHFKMNFDQFLNNLKQNMMKNMFGINITPLQGLVNLMFFPQGFNLCYYILHFQCIQNNVETGFPCLAKEKKNEN